MLMTTSHCQGGWDNYRPLSEDAVHLHTAYGLWRKKITEQTSFGNKEEREVGGEGCWVDSHERLLKLQLKYFLENKHFAFQILNTIAQRKLILDMCCQN